MLKEAYMKLTRIFTVGIGFLLFLFLFIPTASHAESGQTYEVHSTSLNVRSAPADDAQVIGQLMTGDKVVAFQEQYGWIQTYYGGQEVWVAKHHLMSTGTAKSNTASSSEGTAETITVATDNVNIRSGPGENHSIIGSASSGNTYNVAESAGEWYKVSFKDGSTGWIAAWLTSEGAKSQASELETEEAPASKTKSTSTDQQPSNQSLEGYNIVLDPGHGGKDPGSIGLNGVKEKDIISSTADHVAQTLRDAGANVTLTRSGDYFVSLDERVRISDSNHADAFVSLHYNAFPIISIGGISTYYASGSGKNLAQSVQSSLASTVNLQDRGVMQANYRVIQQSSAPAVLMELGFITNPNDLSVVQTSDYQNKVAQAITNGLKNYLH